MKSFHGRGAGSGVDATGLVPERPAVADAASGAVGGIVGCGAARRMRASGGMVERPTRTSDVGAHSPKGKAKRQGATRSAPHYAVVACMPAAQCV